MLVQITGKRYNEILTTTTRQIAENFGKKHYEVIRTIEGRTSTKTDTGETKINNNGLIPMLNQAGKSPLEQYFIPSEYCGDNGKKYKQYLVTRDGFSLLAMGFTGEKALEWKLKYIDAFNKMEEILKGRIQVERQQWQIERDKGVVIRHILTDTIKMKIADSPNKRFAYPNYTNLIYRTLFGKTAKELEKEYGLKSRESLRDFFTGDDLARVQSAEMLVSSLINCGWGYPEIKKFLETETKKMLN